MRATRQARLHLKERVVGRVLVKREEIAILDLEEKLEWGVHISMFLILAGTRHPLGFLGNTDSDSGNSESKFEWSLKALFK